MVYGILNLNQFRARRGLMVGALTALSTVVFLQSKFPDAPAGCYAVRAWGTGDSDLRPSSA